MPKHPESRVGETHDYYHLLSAVQPDDFPLIRFEHHPAPVIEGMRQLWNNIHMRRHLAGVFPELEDRRQLERDLRDRMAELRAAKESDIVKKQKIEERIGRLSVIHHLSVTADQAELCAAAFVQ